MINQEIFTDCLRRAGLAPTVHNTQPARWRWQGDTLCLLCDTDVGLTVGDPAGRDAALSCGAVLEAMVLALSAHDIAVQVTLTGQDTAPQQGLVEVAHLSLSRGGQIDPLHQQLEYRFTWRGAFSGTSVDLSGWSRSDMLVITAKDDRRWIAQRNDWASHQIMQSKAFRKELVSWMRLDPRHPRAGRDGMDRAAMQMTPFEARMAPLALLPLWRVLAAIGLTKSLTSEEEVTLTAPSIVLFHSHISENTINSGRAYLRLCLEATEFGLAGWPMAALSDHPTTQSQISAKFGVPNNRRIVQAVRFGVPTGVAPPRARRDLDEVAV